MKADQDSRLTKSETIEILFIANDDDKPRVLFENFPKAVATTFSSKWRNEFLERKHSGPALIPVKKSITIKGGHFDTYRQILYWMLSCCHGYGISPCPDSIIRRFTTAYFIRMCANHICCDYLVKEATDRMQFIANHQIHCDDVRALWLRTPPDPEMKEFLVDHVATRLWLKSLRGKSSYWALREEFPDFNEAIKKALDAKAIVYKAQKDAVAAARKALVAKGGNFRGGRRQQARQGQQEVMKQKATHHPQQEPEEQKATTEPQQRVIKQKATTQPQQKAIEQNSTNQPQNGTIMLRAEVVRKGVNGRPSYAKLDLASIGVTREQFCIKK